MRWRTTAFTNALANYAVAEAPLWTGNFGEYDAVVGAEVTKVINGELSPADFQANICGMVPALGM